MSVVELVRSASPRAAAPGGSAGGAEVEERTRTRVRTAVAELGPVTAARLAELLGLTGAAVRRHLDAMTAAGVLEAREAAPGRRRGRGRPAREYVVSSAGHDALPSGYDDLALAALDHLARTGGGAAVEDFARRFAEQRSRAVRERLARHDGSGPGGPGGPAGPGADGVAGRVAALAAALAEQGYAASVRPVGEGTPAEGTQLCQGHCPVRRVAEAYPQLCEAEARVFEQVLGTRVQRLATLAQGDHVCTTFVAHPRAAHPGAHPDAHLDLEPGVPPRTRPDGHPAAPEHAPRDASARPPAEGSTPTEGRRR
ncbi:helix-turn-helix transcriptional regulator [Kineococcus terrestris]|uniref:helix-turn-helix transcriptional regulator n=1 Tax=Kineococcus terrestris TaxID=2044856 RepID=UPI0034DB1981